MLTYFIKSGLIASSGGVSSIIAKVGLAKKMVDKTMPISDLPKIVYLTHPGVNLSHGL